MHADVYWIGGPWTGRLAIAARPRGGDWLADEVQGWRAAGIATVVSLLTPEEIAELDLGDEAALCERTGIRFHAVPIEDRGLPGSQATIRHLVQALTEDLMAGRNVLVHCRQGIGRSSLVAASVLAAAGDAPDRALWRIEAARGRPVPDTDDQRRWVRHFAENPSTGYWGRLQQLLQPYGTFARQFLTSDVVIGGFLQSGDILFEPTSGPYRGVLHVVELKWTSFAVLPQDVGLEALDGLVRVRDVNRAVSMRLALATNAMVSESLFCLAQNRGIVLWPSVRTAEEIAAHVIAWSGADGR